MIQKKPKPLSRSAQKDSADVFGSAAWLPPAVAPLALAASPVAAPSAKIKQRLLARIRAGRKAAPQGKVAAAPEGWRFESARSIEGWLQSFPGVRFKQLSVDQARDVALVLVELAPGAQFPDHPHSESPEEFLVISGDFWSGGRLLSAGDYYYAEVGTDHTDVKSPSGCTALLSLRASVWQQFRASLAA